MQIDTARDLLNKAIQEKKREKAEKIFAKDKIKLEKIVKDKSIKLTKLYKDIFKIQKDFIKEINKATKGKCNVNKYALNCSESNILNAKAENIMKSIKIKNENKNDYACLYLNGANGYGVYEKNLPKLQKEIDAFMLDMILGGKMAKDLTALIKKINKIK